MTSLKEKFKILVIIPGPAEGPVMIFSKRQSQSIQNLGMNLNVYYLEKRNSVLILFKYFFQARKIIKDMKPDVVHSQYGTLTAFFSMLLGLPFIVTFHGSDINYTPKDGILRDFFGRFLSNTVALFAKRIICVSSNLVNQVWWSKKKCIVIPVGVNMELFKPMDMESCRHKLGWNVNEFVILFNANNPRIKRIDIAEKAIQLVTGMGKLNVRLEVLHGKVDADRIPLLINASNCLLLCSDNEGSPMIIKEALSCNKPIIATDVGDIANRIRDTKYCKIVEQDPLIIANEIFTILQNYPSAVTNGRDQIMLQGLEEQQIAKQIIEVYKHAIE